MKTKIEESKLYRLDSERFEPYVWVEEIILTDTEKEVEYTENYIQLTSDEVEYFIKAGQILLYW